MRLERLWFFRLNAREVHSNRDLPHVLNGRWRGEVGKEINLFFISNVESADIMLASFSLHGVRPAKYAREESARCKLLLSYPKVGEGSG